jgi:hypothetical protein
VEIYIDDVGCVSMNFSDDIPHLLDTILHRLQANGFTINPYKCEWAVQETDWLGYWLTPSNGLKPWSKKVRALINMSSPTNLKQVRSFLGAIMYYRDMFPRRSHVLGPLTDLIGTSPAKAELRFKKSHNDQTFTHTMYVVPLVLVSSRVELLKIEFDRRVLLLT